MYMRKPPRALEDVAESIFNEAVEEMTRWQRFRAPDSDRVWHWRLMDDQWFWEDTPGDLFQHITTDGVKWWWDVGTEECFLA